MALTQPYSPHTPETMRTARGTIDVPEHMALEEFETLNWHEDDRWELIEGVPCMSPSGTYEHQQLSIILVMFLWNRLTSRGYYVVQDVDISFPGQESYLRPDISVFGPEHEPDGKSLPVRELPVLAVEILSPSTASVDIGPKRTIYERAGLSEYWIVDPATGALMVFARDKSGAFEQVSADSDGRVQSLVVGASMRIMRQGGTFKVLD